MDIKDQERMNELAHTVNKRHKERLATEQFYRIPFRTQLPLWAMQKMFALLPYDTYVIEAGKRATTDNLVENEILVQSSKFPKVVNNVLPDIILMMDYEKKRIHLKVIDESDPQAPKLVDPEWINKESKIVSITPPGGKKIIT